MNPLLQHAAERADAYLDELEKNARSRPMQRPSMRCRSSTANCRTESTDPRAVIDMLDRYATPATMGMAGPRFFGFVIGGALPVSLAANWLATAWDQNTGLYNITPATARLEQIALRWLLERARPAARRAAARSSPARRSRISSRSPRRATPCSSAPAGTSRRTDLFGAPPITVDRRRRSASDVDQIARAARARSQSRRCKVPVDDQGRMRVDALAAIDRPRDRLRAGRQREHRRVSIRSAEIRARTRGATRGCTSTARSACGRAARRRARRIVRGVELRRFVGDRRAQMAQRAVRLRARVRARRRRAARRDGDHRGISADAKSVAQSVGLHAGTVAPRARRRSVGGVAPPRPQRRRRNDRTQLPRRRAASPKRCATAGFDILNDVVLNQVLVVVRRRRAHAARDRRRAGRRHVLVRRHGVARQDGDAHQRLLVGDDGRGCRAQHRGDRARGEAGARSRRSR